ncbi:hypothetical protein [Psychrobacillus sp. FSL H8-0487]|uniref:hypothetical protein n=1 Tax=Psychrobacillus sp. FSL H8-0487 TaxID=2921391 RepID=UPI0030FCA03E
MIIDKEIYREFIKDEYKLQFYLGEDEEPEIVSQILSIIIRYLKSLDEEGDIENFSFEGNRFEINTPRYLIYILVIHSGDVFRYTLNKKTNRKVNYDKRMGLDSRAVLKMIGNFL